MARRLSTTAKYFVLAALLALAALLQYEYDAVLPPSAAGSSSGTGLSPEAIRLIDMGFHSTIASFAWATTMPEVLDLFRDRTEFFPDLSFVTSVDPKLGYPYAFAVLTLPAVPTSSYPDGLAQSFTIGQEGIANADPDWRIPYYMAMNYYLGEQDEKDALVYFNMAANTPGVPQYAERFSLNFGIGTNQRKTTEELWATIASSTNDEVTKARADAYVARLQDFDYLEAAAKVYKEKFGAYPTSTAELVAKGIIPQVPVDPFGFTFILNPDGTAGINLNILPSYIESEPTE